jgi:hypothetical protein
MTAGSKESVDRRSFLTRLSREGEDGAKGLPRWRTGQVMLAGA